MNKSPKTVYWTIDGRHKGGAWIVKYWTKPTNAFTLHLINPTEEMVRANIADVTGRKHFVLEYVKDGVTKETK